MTSTDAVYIEDLAQPVLPDSALELRAQLAPMIADLGLDADEVIAEAREATGLFDFGDGVSLVDNSDAGPSLAGGIDAGFRDRLDLWLTSAAGDEGLSDFGRLSARGLTVGVLKNRLLIEQTIATHPEILDVQIVAPIVIVGLPRSGTTHLHNLMSADPALRSLPYWEALEPVLPDADMPSAGEPDPRLARTEMALSVLNDSMPLFRRMHEMTVDHVHEEIQLLAIDLSSMLFETMVNAPRWREAYLAADQTPHYAYMRRVLQVLQWQRGPERWVLKSPQHLEQLGPIMSVFPDATVVFTHRDPVAVTASFATMAAYLARGSRTEVDPKVIGSYWSDRVQRMLTGVVRDRHRVPADQSIDIKFHEYMGNDIGTVEAIYAKAELPFTHDVRVAMDQFMADHPRGRFGRIRYDLEPLGIDLAERRDALQFYVDRFDLELEPDTNFIRT